MQNIFIDVLPPWVETGLQPAFYDLESGTVLQQTARMYAKVRELTQAFNDFSEEVTNEVNTFETNVTNTVNDYIQRFNELYTYVHDYFDNLDVQEEINNKIDDMVESGDFQQIVGTYLGIVTPQMFGAVSGTNDDQSEAISDCLDYAFTHGIKNVYLDGDYFVDSTIAFENKSDIAIKNGTIRVHETTEKLADGFSIFSFMDCNNINFENVRFIETSPESRVRNLYKGGIYFGGCGNCSIRGCYFENTHNGIMLRNNCHDCIVENNEVYVDQHSTQFACSAILNYSSYDNTIKNNTITGEYYDGTLSVYGGYCKNVIVDGNTIKGIFDDHPYYLSEGICIDAATDGTIVTNNIVSGQYYGIDNKNDARNTLIENNYVFGCKCGITDRWGEENKLTYNCKIQNNTVVIQTMWDTDTSLADILYKGVYYYEGIYVSGRLGACVKGNKICLFKKTDTKTVCAINCDGTNINTSSNVYVNQYDIEGNTIEFANGFGSGYWYAGANSTGIYIADVQKGSITSNTLKVDTAGSHYAMITFGGDASYVNVNNNSYFATSTINHVFVEKGEDVSVTNCKVVNNLLKQCVPKFNLGHASNLVQMTKYDIQAHQIAPVSLTYNTWATVATITPPYAGLFHINIGALRQSSGDKYIFGEYMLNIGNDSVSATTILEEKSGLEVQFVHGANAKSCDIQVKAGSNINNFDELFFYNLMGEQYLTIS